MSLLSFFFFNDTATTEIYTLSLHDALPIFRQEANVEHHVGVQDAAVLESERHDVDDHLVAVAFTKRVDQPLAELMEIGRATRLNSSHANISYAVFCLKKKKTQTICLTCNAI